MIRTLEFDPPTAKIIASLPFISRNRLDDSLRKREPFSAAAEEIGIDGVTRLIIRIIGGKNGKPVTVSSMITFKNDLIWTNWRLEISVSKFNVPRGVLSALKGKPMAVVIDHPLFADFTISAARLASTTVIFQARRQAMIPYGDISKSGHALPDMSRLDFYERHAIKAMDPIAAHAVATLGPQALAVLSGRLDQFRCVEVTDLMPWKPNKVRRIQIEIADGMVHSFLSTTLSMVALQGNEIRHTASHDPKSVKALLNNGLFDMGRPYTPGLRVWKLVHERLEIDQIETFLRDPPERCAA